MITTWGNDNFTGAALKARKTRAPESVDLTVTRSVVLARIADALIYLRLTVGPGVARGADAAEGTVCTI